MSYISTNGKVALSDRRHTWTDQQGDVWSVLDLGDVSIVFGSAKEARQIAAACIEIADAIEARQAEMRGGAQ